MTRILAVGAAPLPTESRGRLDASGLRTWHLVQPLLAAGHRVRLVAVRNEAAYDSGSPPVIEERQGALEYLAVRGALFHRPEQLQRYHDDFEPDLVVGINTYPASRAVVIETQAPIWADLNGWVMAEAQAKAKVYDDDVYLSHFWRMERRILDRADAFSAVSRAQAHAIAGELATRGRLGRQNFGYEFTHHIPNAIVDTQPPSGGPRRLRDGDARLGDDAFIVLWLGGYNTWTDTDLLFRSLESAMEANPKICFASTGGTLPGHDETTFVRFREQVDRSPHRDRFVFLGWIPTAEISPLLQECDLGLNVDSRNYETVFGARNRINEMVRHRLPVLSTQGTEVSLELSRSDLILTSPIGDASAFAERITWASRNPARLEEMSEAALSFAEREYSYAATTRPLQRFAEAPRRAPDLGERVPFRDVDFYRSVPVTEAPFEDDLDPGSRIKHLEDYLDRLQSSRFFRAWMLYHKVLRKLRLLPPHRDNE